MAAELKRELMEKCRLLLSERTAALSSALNEISESINTETKSSVGDKHETARARMQFEQEKLSKQLDELKTQAVELNRIDVSAKPVTAAYGSLIETERGSFFVSVALGKLILEGKEIYAISPSSPLAQAFKGCRQNDAVSFNGTTYRIKKLD
jgi:hypothetical protein